jgi:hypothetical protein
MSADQLPHITRVFYECADGVVLGEDEVGICAERIRSETQPAVCARIVVGACVDPSLIPAGQTVCYQQFKASLSG